MKIGGNPTKPLNFIILATVMVAGENLLRDPSDVPTKDFARDVPAQCFEFTYTYLPCTFPTPLAPKFLKKSKL